MTEESYFYGYDDTIKLHESGLFLIKGKSKVLLNKLPIGIKEVRILDEHAHDLNIQGKVFTFSTYRPNILLVTTNEDEYYEFIYDGNRFIER
jgi:hypothetical protein